MDSIIEEMGQKILDWRKFPIHRHDAERWARHLREVVQPQLDELEALKTAAATKSVSKKAAVTA